MLGDLILYLATPPDCISLQKKTGLAHTCYYIEAQPVLSRSDASRSNKLQVGKGVTKPTCVRSDFQLCIKKVTHRKGF